MSAYLGIALGGMSPAGGRLPLDSGRLNVGSGLCPCLTVGDTVMVKLACMGVEACRFWRGLEGHGNALVPPSLYSQKHPAFRHRWRSWPLAWIRRGGIAVVVGP